MIPTLVAASPRKTPVHWVSVGSLRMLFSYETCMAFHTTHGPTHKILRRPHHYSNTTARHLHETGTNGWPRAESDEEFERQLSYAFDEAVHPALPAMRILEGDS